jgi:hypothetical protein
MTKTIHPEPLTVSDIEIPDALLADLARVPAEVVPVPASYSPRVMWRTRDDRHLTADQHGPRWLLTSEGFGCGGFGGSCMRPSHAIATARRVIAEHRDAVQPDLFGEAAA